MNPRKKMPAAMNEVIAAERHRPWLYLGLALLFFACLWIGWRDFDPLVPQHEVREGIRALIRGSFQFLFQYAIPIAILLYFASKTLGRFRPRQD